MKANIRARLLTLTAAVALGAADDAGAQQLQVFLHYDYMILADQGTACSVAADCDAGQACAEGMCRGHSHQPDQKAVQAVVDAFARQGIEVHVDHAHNAIPERKVLIVEPHWSDPSCAGTDAVPIGELRATYLHAQSPRMHYSVFGHYTTCPDAAHCASCPPLLPGEPAPDPASTGFGELPGWNFAVAMANVGTPPVLAMEASTFMHELGHNFGLQHGGSEGVNQKPHYLSVMNYTYQFLGIVFAEEPGSSQWITCADDRQCGAEGFCQRTDSEVSYCFRVDYSRQELPGLNESSLDESVGVAGEAGDTDLVFYYAPGSAELIGPSNGGPIDWNGDGIIESQVSVDVNNDGSFTYLPGFDDWAFVRSTLAMGGPPPGTPARVVHEPAPPRGGLWDGRPRVIDRPR